MRRFVLLVVMGMVGCASSPEQTRSSGQWVRTPEPLRTAGSDAGDGMVEIAIADPCVRVDSDGQFHLWYQGPRATSYVSDDGEMWIRHGTSSDGMSFVVSDVPSLRVGEPGAWDQTHTETPTVVEVPTNPAERRFVMAYSGAGGVSVLGFPDYQVGVAFSSDGQQFERLGAAHAVGGQLGLAMDVATGLSDVPGTTHGVVADPELVWDGQLLHLFYSSFAGDDDGNILAFGIGHSVSDDGGLSFTPVVGAPIPGLLDEGGIGGQQPSVSFNAHLDRWEMVFTDDDDAERLAMPSTFNPSMGVWMATSDDLYTWTVDLTGERTFAWDASFVHEELGLLTGASLLVLPEERRLYYTGWGTQDVPEGFAVPTHSGVESAVLNLLLASEWL